MSYKSKDILTDKSDKPIPQYFNKTNDKFEDLRGSDGASHTKIVDSTGEPIDKLPVSLDLPEDYPDQAVEARLQAIEQTQSQILDKLNDTIDTRLTGSNVEDGVLVKGLNKYQVDTVVNAQTVESGKNVLPRVSHMGESETYVLISTDKDGWWARATIGPWTSSGNINDFTLYPSVGHDTRENNKSASTIFPSKHLYVLEGRYESWGEAIQFTQISDFAVYFFNSSDDDATVTIRVLRLWR